MDMSDATIELFNNQERILSGDYEWQQVLAGKSFYLPLSPGNLAQQSDQQDAEVASSSLQPSLLASFDYTNFRETDDSFEDDGVIFSYNVSLNIKPNPIYSPVLPWLSIPLNPIPLMPPPSRKGSTSHASLPYILTSTGLLPMP